MLGHTGAMLRLCCNHAGAMLDHTGPRWEHIGPCQDYVLAGAILVNFLVSF
jgi:hypothetical protein